jgi:hypothetical protein
MMQNGRINALLNILGEEGKYSGIFFQLRVLFDELIWVQKFNVLYDKSDGQAFG